MEAKEGLFEGGRIITEDGLFDGESKQRIGETMRGESRKEEEHKAEGRDRRVTRL